MKKRVLVIRDCKKADLPALQPLVDELYLTDTGPDAEIPDVQLTYKALKASPKKGRLLVFEQGGELIGYAIIIFFWSNEFAGDIVEIDEILVIDEARGMGVATRFFQWLTREYKGVAKGWSLQVKPSNKAALRLYEGLGFRYSANWHMHNIFAWNSRRSKTATTGGGKRKSAAGK